MKKNNTILNLVLAFLPTIAFSLNLKMPTAYLQNFYHLNIIIYVVLFFSFYRFFSYVEKNTKNEKWILLLSIVIAGLQVLGYFYCVYGSISNMIKTPFQIGKSIIVFLGYTILFSFFFRFIENGIERLKYKKPKNKICQFIFEDHPVLSTVIILFLCYLPFLILFYPGTASADMQDEVFQFFHLETPTVRTVNLIDPKVYINGHHSPFHTVIVGSICQLGLWLGSANYGLFLNVLLQLALYLYVLSYTMKLCKQLKVPIFFRIIMLCIYAFCPYFNMNVIGTFKDVPFSMFILLYFCHLIEFVVLKQQDKKTILKMIFSSLLIGLMTKKGFYVLLISILPMLYIYRKKGVRFLLCLFLPLCLVIGYEKVLLPALHVTPGSIREPLAMPINQVARYVKNHKDDVTKEERKAIDNLLPFDEIGDLYNPRLADPVKARFNKNWTKEQVKDFIITYIKLFPRHPESYISCFLNQTFGYYYINYTFTPGFYTVIEERTLSYQFDIDRPAYSEKASIIIKKINTMLQRMPIINMFYSLAFYCWTLIFCVLSIGKRKGKENVVPFLPLIGVYLLLFISPDCDNMRYVLPIIYSAPLFVALAMATIKREKKQ